MTEWRSGQKRHMRRIMLDDIKLEGVHLHAQRTITRVRAQIAKRLRELRLECIDRPRLSEADRLYEKIRARRAYGLS